MNRLKKGYVQIFTGNGKGKTTAALGQALRAAGSGLTTFIVMFMKDFSYGEIPMIKHLSEWIRLEQYGNDTFVIRKQSPDNEDKKAAQLALRQARETKYNVNCATIGVKFQMELKDNLNFESGELLKTIGFF